MNRRNPANCNDKYTEDPIMDRVKGKIALVTGGSSGIGKAACDRLAREGASVIVADIQDEEGEKTAGQLADDGLTAAFQHMDVSDENNVREAMASVREDAGPITVLVNNAGIRGANQPTHETSAEDWRKVIDVNLMGVVHCTKHAVPQMMEAGGGSIVNLSSIYGLVGGPDVPPYHASKGAVTLMSKTDALLYADRNIRVNSVHPAYIWTPMVEQFGRELGQEPDAFRRQLSERHPVGRVGEPDDIAWGVVYLASDESAFVTGSELVIDGGYTAR